MSNKTLAHKIADLVFHDKGWQHRYTDAYDLANIQILELPELKAMQVEPLTYLTIIDKDHNLLVSGKGQFNFNDKTILHNDITIFLSNKEPHYENVDDMIKFYPEGN